MVATGFAVGSCFASASVVFVVGIRLAAAVLVVGIWWRGRGLCSSDPTAVTVATGFVVGGCFASSGVTLVVGISGGEGDAARALLRPW